MNEDFELNDIDDFPDEPVQEDDSSEPEYATQDDLRAFAQELLGEIQSQQNRGGEEPEYEDPLEGYDPEFVHDMRRVLGQQAQAIHAEYAPILSASIANQAAQMVAGEMGSDAQSYIGQVISLMDPLAAKAMLNDPMGVEMLHNMAIGRQAKSGSGNRVPRTYEPGGIEFDTSFSQADRASLNSFMKAFGVDKKRATELFRDAQKAGRH
ncbi:MAG: hypothetical protein WCG75_07330 [Armatimonadota bacterium]